MRLRPIDRPAPLQLDDSAEWPTPAKADETATVTSDATPAKAEQTLVDVLIDECQRLDQPLDFRQQCIQVRFRNRPPKSVPGQRVTLSLACSSSARTRPFRRWRLRRLHRWRKPHRRKLRRRRTPRPASAAGVRPKPRATPSPSGGTRAWPRPPPPPPDRRNRRRRRKPPKPPTSRAPGSTTTRQVPSSKTRCHRRCTPSVHSFACT